MFTLYKSLFLILLCFFISACSSKNQAKFQSASLEKTLQKQTSLDRKIKNFYKEYKGVKYKYAGTSKNGIDCSSLTQKFYKNNFGIIIPRTTLEQSKKGFFVKKHHLKKADLVFFKTGKNTRHVGIYLGNGKFMHASTSKGVTISKLDNIYFSKRYWKAKRLIH